MTRSNTYKVIAIGMLIGILLIAGAIWTGDTTSLSEKLLLSGILVFGAALMGGTLAAEL